MASRACCDRQISPPFPIRGHSELIIAQTYNGPVSELLAIRFRLAPAGAVGVRDEPLLSRPQPRLCTRWTFAGKTPKNRHFSQLLGTPGVIPTCRDSIVKSFPAKGIGPDLWCSGRSRYLVAEGPQNRHIDGRLLFTISAMRAIAVPCIGLLRISLQPVGRGVGQGQSG